MALFPVSPTNGQQTNVNSITYTYDSSQTAWVRTAVDGNISAGNAVFSGNLAVGSNLTVGGTANITNGQLFSNNLLLQGDGTDGYIRPTNSSSRLFLGANNTNYLTITAAGAVNSAGNITAPRLISNISTGTAPFVVTSTTQVANLNVATAGSATTAGTVTTAAQPNITSVGTITSLSVSSGATLATSSGNVGVGAPSPNTRLQVSGITPLNAPVLGNASGAPFYITNNDLAYGLVFGTNAADGHSWIQAQRTDGTATAYNITLNEAGGNVGIGNTAPTDKLSVNGNVVADNFVGNLSNGNSSISIPDANGNINLNAAGSANIFKVTSNGVNVVGRLYQTGGNITLNGITLANTLYTYNFNVYGPTGTTIYYDRGNGVSNSYVLYTNTGNVFTIDGFNGAGANWRFYAGNGTFASNTVVSANNYISSVTTGITANGSTQATATAITKDINVVSTVLTGNGVALPTAVAGYTITLINTSANALNVYPLGNGIINALGANTAYSLAANARLQIVCTSSTTAPGGQWYTL